VTNGIGILGGTFDPIHYGHLHMADEVRAALDLAEVRLIPAGNPYHRATAPPRASALQRLAMARLAVADFPGLAVDPREALQSTPSYTVDTLTSLRTEMGATPLLLLLGADAFVTLPSWRRWIDLFDLAHLVIIARPGYEVPTPLPAALAAEWAVRATEDSGLLSRGTGRIYSQWVSPQPISATRIRAMLQTGQRPDGLLPAAVVAYIETHSLYRS
jgi:nicotinate-nucleotide adenylyltransferase